MARERLPACRELRAPRTIRARGTSLYDLLLPYGSLNAVGVPELALGSTSRQLGILAALLGRVGDALDHFEEALPMNELMGARPWVGQTLEEHAGMLLRRDDQADRPRAEELLARAHASYDELGMKAATPTGS